MNATNPTTNRKRHAIVRAASGRSTPAVPSVKIDEAMDEWRMYLHAANASRHTIHGYTTSMKMLVAFLVDNGTSTIVRDITSNDIRAFLSWTLNNRSDATALTRWAGILAFFKFATEQGFTAASPMAGVQRPKTEVKVIPRVAADDIRTLFRSFDHTTFDGARDYAIMRLLLDNGLRRSEVAAITTSDVDFRDMVILIHGKGKRQRVVGISSKTGLALKRYLRLRADWQSTRPDAHLAKHSDHVFIGKRGQLTGIGIEHMLRRRCTAAGIERANAHAWRHTWAGEWMESGGSELALQSQGGWTSNRMIGRYAAHNVQQASLAEARRLNIGGDL